MGTMSNFEAMVTKKHDLELKDKKEKMIQGVVSKMQKKLAESEPELLVDDLDGDVDDLGDDVDMPLTPSSLTCSDLRSISRMQLLDPIIFFISISIMLSNLFDNESNNSQ